jgi:hypothetical protein
LPLHPQAGATTIRIPVSLSDVYEGTWTIDNNGEITSSWSFGGSFILFQGRTPRSAHTDSRLASVTGTLPAGSFRVPVRCQPPLGQEAAALAASG